MWRDWSIHGTELTQCGAAATVRGSVMLRKIRGPGGNACAMATPCGAMLKLKPAIRLAFTTMVTILAVFGAQPPTAVQAQSAHSWKNDGDQVRHVVITV